MEWLRAIVFARTFTRPHDFQNARHLKTGSLLLRLCEQF